MTDERIDMQEGEVRPRPTDLCDTCGTRHTSATCPNPSAAATMDNLKGWPSPSSPAVAGAAGRPCGAVMRVGSITLDGLVCVRDEGHKALHISADGTPFQKTSEKATERRWNACAGDDCPELQSNGKRIYFPHIHLGPKDHEQGFSQSITINSSGTLEACDADARLIVSAVNSVDALRAEVSSLKAEVARLKEAASGLLRLMFGEFQDRLAHGDKYKAPEQVYPANVLDALLKLHELTEGAK